jgi:hypothetical protein
MESRLNISTSRIGVSLIQKGGLVGIEGLLQLIAKSAVDVLLGNLAS